MPDRQDTEAELRVLVFYDAPLLVSLGSPQNPYIGFACGDAPDGAASYIVVSFSEIDFETFMRGRLSAIDAAKSAGGNVYLTSDFRSYRAFPLAEIHEDDLAVLECTGADFAELMEIPPFP